MSHTPEFLPITEECPSKIGVTCCVFRKGHIGIHSFESSDLINHPNHYNFGTIEVITVIEDWKLGFNLGNAIKYIGRADHKGNKLEDLKKAKWYLEREISNMENIAK